MKRFHAGISATISVCMISMATRPIYAATPAQIEITGADLAAGQFARNPLFASGPGMHYREGVGRPPSPAAPATPAVTFGFFPADVANPDHNPTLQNLAVHDIFVNPSNPSPNVFAQSPTGPTLADVDTFVDNLNRSDFIHLTDQYTGSTNPSRTVGQGGIIKYETGRQTLYDADVAVLVHAAARTFGAGYSRIYHVFFAQGTDVCTSGGGNSSFCYSPDDFSTFYFCGYHSYFDFGDLGHVIYSVEPYTNVPGCMDPTSPAGASPNGPAIDSMANVLSHEIFEAITDPDLNAWYNRFGAFAGNEIGDECAFVFALPPVSLNGKPYQIQSEYSNFYHACIWTSSGPPAP